MIALWGNSHRSQHALRIYQGILRKGQALYITLKWLNIITGQQSIKKKSTKYKDKSSEHKDKHTDYKDKNTEYKDKSTEYKDKSTAHTNKKYILTGLAFHKDGHISTYSVWIKHLAKRWLNRSLPGHKADCSSGQQSCFSRRMRTGLGVLAAILLGDWTLYGVRKCGFLP